MLLGVVGFVGQIPTFVISPLAGVFADRHDRRNMLLVTQSLSMLQASLLAFLVLTHQIQVWHVILLSAFIGVVNSFDIPVRQAFTIEMIEDPENLGNAIALNSSMLNASRLIGPSVAGLLIASMGEGICFLLNAASYIAVLFSLSMMKIAKRQDQAQKQHVLSELKEGFSYVSHFAPIKWILLLLALVSLMGVPYQVLMPIFARDVFSRWAAYARFFNGHGRMRAMVGALYLAARKSVIGLGRIIGLAAILFGISMTVFSQSRIFEISMLVLFFSGFGMMVHMASCNTILQTIAEEDKRGRVMSFYTMSFMGMMPFGSLLAGSLASKIGAPHTVLIGAAAAFWEGSLF